MNGGAQPIRLHSDTCDANESLLPVLWVLSRGFYPRCHEKIFVAMAVAFASTTGMAVARVIAHIVS